MRTKNPTGRHRSDLVERVLRHGARAILAREHKAVEVRETPAHERRCEP